jgi:hypothetical protein
MHKSATVATGGARARVVAKGSARVGALISQKQSRDARSSRTGAQSSPPDRMLVAKPQQTPRSIRSRVPSTTDRQLTPDALTPRLMVLHSAPLANIAAIALTGHNLPTSMTVASR